MQPGEAGEAGAVPRQPERPVRLLGGLPWRVVGEGGARAFVAVGIVGVVIVLWGPVAATR